MPHPTPATQSPFRLGLLLFPGCMPAGLFAASDMVRACNLRAGGVRMTVTWVGVAIEDISTHNGPHLRAQSTIADCNYDALLLPGLWLTSTSKLEDAIRAQMRLVNALRALPSMVPMWSYCAGVALAAAAGRLDGHQATATWWLQPALATHFKHVQWLNVHDIVKDRDAITASGPNGYLPLMLDQLAQHFSVEVLHDVQELLMLPNPRRRHPSFETVEMMRLNNPTLRSLLTWAQRTPAQEITLLEAAQQQSMSVRTLARLVDRESGIGAGEWLRIAKLSQAAEALRSTLLPIKVISDDLGYANEASLYRAFKSITGLTPSAYRQTFGSTNHRT